MSFAIRSRGPRALSARAAVAVAVLALTGGCSATAGPAAAPAPAATTFTSKLVSAATLTTGQAIAAPAQKPVFTVTGAITAQNRDGTLVLDRPTLERLGVHQVRLYEPWTKEHLEFRGVWLQDLVTVAGAGPEATRLHIVALDDYAIDLSLADVRAGGIMIATSAGDGSDIPVDRGGPTRVVFMDGVTAGVNPDQWVWSIKTIDVV